jgi:hypothetical protein
MWALCDAGVAAVFKASKKTSMKSLSAAQPNVT